MRKSSRERAQLLREARNAAPRPRLLLIFDAITPLDVVDPSLNCKQYFIGHGSL
jgi:hypothetical protein